MQSFEGEDLEIFELIAGDILTELGYPLYSTSLNAALLFDDKIEHYKNENIRLKKQSIVDAKENDLKKRKPQEQIIAEIKKRVLA